MQDHKLTRRSFLTQAAVAIPTAAVFGNAVAQAPAVPHLNPDEPAAKALVYNTDATKVDTKNPLAARYKAGQTCSNCVQVNAPSGDWRPCKIFPGKLVSAKGWCSVWAANP